MKSPFLPLFLPPLPQLLFLLSPFFQSFDFPRGEKVGDRDFLSTALLCAGRTTKKKKKKDMHISRKVIIITTYNRITFFPPCLFLISRDYKKHYGQEEEENTFWLGTKGDLNTLLLKRVFFFPDAHGTLHNSSKNKCTAFRLSYRSNYQWTQRWMGAQGVGKRPQQEIQTFKA